MNVLTNPITITSTINYGFLIQGSIKDQAERRRVSADVKNALENDNTWHFDVIQLEKITEYHALSQLGMKV